MPHRLTSLVSAVIVLAWAPAPYAQIADIWSAAGVTGIYG